MPATLHIEWQQTDAAAILQVGGEVDLATTPQLERSIDFDIYQEVLILDLAGVTFIDSTGLRTLVAAHDAAGDVNKELRIVASEKVDTLLQITGLHERLNVYGDRESALADA